MQYKGSCRYVKKIRICYITETNTWRCAKIPSFCFNRINKIIIQTYLAHKEIRFIKVSTKHLRCFTWNRFNFNANLKTFASRFNLLVIALYRCNNTQIYKLQRNKTYTYYPYKIIAIVYS